MKSEDKTPAKTQTEPDARSLPDSEVRPLREHPDERQDRPRRESEADPVIEFVIKTVVRNVAGTVRRNVKDNVQNAVLETVADYVSRNLAGFHDKAIVRTIETGVANNVAESENEFDPDFDDRFAAESVARSIASMSSIIGLTQIDTELLSMPMETESLSSLMKTRSKALLCIDARGISYSVPEIPRTTSVPDEPKKH